MTALETRIAIVRRMAGVAGQMLQGSTTLTRLMDKTLNEPEKFGRMVGQLRLFAERDYPWAAQALTPILAEMEAAKGGNWCSHRAASRDRAAIERADFQCRHEIRAALARLRGLDGPSGSEAYDAFIRREYRLLPTTRGDNKRLAGKPAATNVVAGPWGGAA